LNRNCISWLDIGGCEPFLRDDLVDLCRQFQAAETDVPTGGWLVDKTLDTAREGIRAKQCFCTHESNMLDSTLLNPRSSARVMLLPKDKL